MDSIKSKISTNDEQFKNNKTYHLELLSKLGEEHAKVRQGGGDSSVAKHRARGKLMARERIEAILDEGSSFLELSALAAHNLYDEDVPSAST